MIDKLAGEAAIAAWPITRAGAIGYSFGFVIDQPGRCSLELFFCQLVAAKPFHTEPNAPLPIHFEHFNFDVVSFLELIAHVLHPLL